MIINGKPHYAFVDIETNALFRDAPADAEGQARMAEVDIIMTDAELKEVGRYHAYVYPDGWKMTLGATQANGITDDMLRYRGEPIANIMDEIEWLMKEHNPIWIAFNAIFDAKVLRDELRRAGKDSRREETQWLCSRNMALKVLGKSRYEKGTTLAKIANLLEITDYTSMLGARRDNDLSLEIFRTARGKDPTIGEPFIIRRKKPMPKDRLPFKGRD